MSFYCLPNTKFRKQKRIISEEEWNSLKDISDISLMVQKLSELLEIPDDDINERRNICNELQERLRCYFFETQLDMHGSSIQGLAIKNSDLDLYFNPSPSYISSIKDFSKSEQPSIPEPSSIRSGKTSKDVLTELDEFSILKFIRKALQENKGYVNRVYFHSKESNCPNLRILLRKRRTVCNLTICSRHAIYTTRLLKTIGNLDPCIKPLFIALRFWAKTLGFFQKAYFSEYAFTLLIIFFLQNASPPVLPPFCRIYEISGDIRLVATSSYESDLNAYEKLVKKSKFRNPLSVEKLFVDFFEYYWNFDFEKNIICPYSGSTLSKENLKNSMDEKMSNFSLSSINIQDPLILSINACTFHSSINIFKLLLLKALQMLENIKAGKIMFKAFFDCSEYEKELGLHYDKSSFENPRVVCFFSLDYELRNESDRYDNASKALFDVLQYGLLIECEVTDKVLGGKKIASEYKNNGFSANHGSAVEDLKKLNLKNKSYDLQLLTSIQCVLYSRTWIGRKNITETTVSEEELKEFSDCNALKAEYAISRELLKKNPNLTNPTPLLCFRCDLYKHVSPQISDLVVMLKPITYKREFYQISTFLSSYIPKTVKKVLAYD